MKKTITILVFTLFIFSLQSCIVSQKPNMGFFDNPHYDYKGAQFTSINVPMFLAKPFVKKALRDDGESEELINLINAFAKYLIRFNSDDHRKRKRRNGI